MRRAPERVLDPSAGHVGATDASATLVRTTPAEDRVTTLFVTWLFIGVFADFWAHKNLAPAETIITPWHAVLYSGFAATAAWILHLIDRRDGRGWRQGTPVGYSGALVGIVLTAAAAVTDLTWHTVFGAEQGIDALVSPPHLTLFTGFTLIAMAPVASVAHRPGRVRSASELAPAIAGVTFVTSLWMLVVRFLALFQNDLAPVSQEPTGVARMVVTTTLLTAAIVYVVRRWDPPLGAMGSLTLGVVLAVGVTDEFHAARAILAGVAAAVAIEVLFLGVRPRLHERMVRVAVAGASAAVLAATWLAAYALQSDQGWHPASLAGSVTLCGLAGVAVAELMQPRAHETQ
jgi:hypothetical protein